MAKRYQFVLTHTDDEYQTCNCGMSYKECVCHRTQHAPPVNEYENLMIDAIDERSGANDLMRVADTICQTNEILKVMDWSDSLTEHRNMFASVTKLPTTGVTK